MSSTFINGLSCISAQPSFSGDFPMQFCENSKEAVLFAMEPPYKDYIPPAAIRRMSKSVKMGMVAASVALERAHLTPQAIFVGTGMGCLQDSEKFLKTLLDNQEQHLTPTAFIQSTHNTVAGQIAINLQCKGMNLTYVNGACSFESALLEAKMHMEQGQLQHILVGGIDEHSPHTTYLYELAGIIKDKAMLPCPRGRGYFLCSLGYLLGADCCRTAQCGDTLPLDSQRSRGLCQRFPLPKWTFLSGY